MVSSWAVNSYASELEVGKKIYGKYCVKCHGEDGSGSKFGMALQPKPARDLRTNRLFLSDGELLVIINHGGSMREMPNWQYVLNDDELKKTAGYVRTLNYSSDWKNGERLFMEKCAMCHASDGVFKNKWSAPDLDRSTLGPHDTARIIRFGFHNTFMYPRETVHTNAEIADIVAYIQGLKN